MKTGWLILTIILFGIGSLMLVDSVYWIIIGYSTQYGTSFVVGTFVAPLVLYLISYETLKRAKKTSDADAKNPQTAMSENA